MFRKCYWGRICCGVVDELMTSHMLGNRCVSRAVNILTELKKESWNSEIEAAFTKWVIDTAQPKIIKFA